MNKFIKRCESVLTNTTLLKARKSNLGRQPKNNANHLISVKNTDTILSSFITCKYMFLDTHTHSGSE